MPKGGHRITLTLRDRNPQETELWEQIAPMLRLKQFNAYAVNLLIEDLLLTDEERERRRYTRRLLEQAVMHGEPGAQAVSLRDLITTGVTQHEGSFVETQSKE